MMGNDVHDIRENILREVLEDIKKIVKDDIAIL